MILGFLGKGGSGKSSVATQMGLLLNSVGKKVLAVDADHNMDLSYNLLEGRNISLSYFSQSLSDLEKTLKLDVGKKYSEAFLSEVTSRFHLSPLSAEIEKFSVLLDSGIRLMTAGPQTENVLYGKSCSHSLTTPLKLLLPLLELKQNEVVVVDEKAGADGVSTGIVTGIDVGVIVAEPALHSVKTAKQIAKLMDFYETPYLFVGNKITSSDDKDFIVSELGVTPTAFLMESSQMKRNPSKLVFEWVDELKTIFSESERLNQNNRLDRTIKKFKRNSEFAGH